MKIKWSKSSSVTEVLDRKCLEKTEFKNFIQLFLTRALSSCISARIWFPPHWYWSHSKATLHLITSMTYYQQWGGHGIRHCPLASKQHQYHNLNQQHQELSSGPPSKLSKNLLLRRHQWRSLIIWEKNIFWYLSFKQPTMESFTHGIRSYLLDVPIFALTTFHAT